MLHSRVVLLMILIVGCCNVRVLYKLFFSNKLDLFLTRTILLYQFFISFLSYCNFNYPRVEHLALPTNIRLGLKGLPGTNTQAYYKNNITKVVISKDFISIVVVSFYKRFN